MIILTEAQRKEEQSSRLKEFQEGIKALSEKTLIDFRPQITPDGPTNIFIDLKKYEDSTPQ